MRASYAPAAAVLCPLLQGAGREKRPVPLIGAGTGALLAIGWPTHGEAIGVTAFAAAMLVLVAIPLTPAAVAPRLSPGATDGS